MTGNNSTPRSADFDNKLWLRIDSETYTIQSRIGLGFVPEASPAFDPGYDSRQLATTISLFSTLEDGQRLSIQGREIFDPAMEINLGFQTIIPESENYTISIEQLEGTGLEQSDIILIDHLLGTTTSLKETSYTFAASETIQENRFTLVFEDQLLNVDENSIDNSISLYPNPAQNIVTIASTNTALQEAVVYDLTGRLVQTIAIDGNTTQVDVSRLSVGSYILQLTTVNGDTVIKRFIKN